MKLHNIKKCTVFQNNQKLDAQITATGFPYENQAARKVHKVPSDAKGAVLQPKTHKDPGLVLDNLLEVSEKDILVSSSPDLE
jgi:hypothetical protein